MPIRPTLDVKALKRAYEALQRASSVAGSPLLGFVLVQLHLQSPHVLSGELAAQRALFDVLSDVLADELARVRGPGRPRPDVNCSLARAIEDMRLDGASPMNKLRIAYSAIFYRYVRADLDLTVQDIAGYLGHDVRAVHRYATDAWQHLVQSLVQREMQARQDQRRTRCLLALPRYEMTVLSTQQVDIETGYKMLTAHAPHALLIHGGIGTGKTTVAFKIAQMMLEKVDEIVWLDLSSAKLGYDEAVLANLVIDALSLYRPPQLTALEIIQSYLQMMHHNQQQVLVVLDDVDGWESKIEAASVWLSHCVLIVTAHSYWDTWFGRQLRCSPLDEDDAYDFLEFLQRTSPQRRSDEDYQAVWRAVGGNLVGIKLAFQLLDIVPSGAKLSEMVLADLYESAWKHVPSEAQRLWFLVEVAGSWTGIEYERLVSLAATLGHLDHGVIDESLVLLWRHGLLDNQDYRYSVPVGAAVTLTKYLHEYAAEFLAQVLCQDISVEMGWLAFQFLHKQHYYAEFHSRLAALLPFARQFVVKVGCWERWLNLMWALVDEVPDPLRFQFEAAIALRWLGHFQHALQVLNEVIAHQQGDELVLGEALVEKATILFYQQENQQSAELAQEAHRIFEVLGAHAQLQKCKVAMVRALSHIAPQRARHHAAEIVIRDAAVWDLLARLEMRLGNGREALKAAREAVKALEEDDPRYPRSLGVLAHAMIINGDVQKALEYFEYALNLLQVKQDAVALARMYNNFGVALSQAEKKQEAQQQFMRSLELHKCLQDEHGRSVAEENLRLLQ